MNLPEHGPRYPMTPILLIALVSLTSGAAAAQGFSPDDLARSRFEIVNTRTGLRLDFVDGRVAQLHTARSEEEFVPLKMAITENTCYPASAPARCSLILPFRVYVPSFIWTRHPDPARIGQVVHRKQNPDSPEQPLSNGLGTYFLSVEDRQRTGEEVITRPMEFVCDDYAWLTGSADGSIPRWFTINTWGSEINTINFESGINENQTFSGGFNIQLTAVFGRKYIVSSGLFFASIPLPALVSTGPATLVYRRSDHELCQSSFSMDASALERKAQEVVVALQKGPFEPRSLAPIGVDRELETVTRLKKALDASQSNEGVIP